MSGKIGPHVRWDLPYYVVIVPKYGEIVNALRNQIGPVILKELMPTGVEVWKGTRCGSPCRVYWATPPKYSIAFVIGFLKGKSAVRIHRQSGEAIARDSLLCGWRLKTESNSMKTLNTAPAGPSYVPGLPGEELRNDKRRSLCDASHRWFYWQRLRFWRRG